VFFPQGLKGNSFIYVSSGMSRTEKKQNKSCDAVVQYLHIFYFVLPIFKGFPSKNRNICNNNSYLC